MKRLNGAGTRAMGLVREFTIAQRTIAIIGVAVLVLGGFALANQLSKPTYEPLYSNLASADAAAVVAQLTTDGVPHQLDGTTILVPADEVDAERLATAGMISSATGGYSLLDDMGVTASEFQQNATYKRAIEGELAQTIGSIDGVSAASVQLAIPEQTVFTDEQQQPKAAVFLETAQPLSSEQVGAIVHFVSAAYPGLEDANVSVTDQKGSILSVAGGAAGSASDEAGDYETRTRTAVQAMLDEVFGPGKAIVTVAADVSRSSGTRTSEQYTSPPEAPVISESTNEQSYSGTGSAAASGVLGTDTTSTTATDSGDGTYTSTQGVKNNGVDKTTTSETIVPGTLNRQTIAVALDDSVLVTPAAVRQLVSDAAGVDTTRGDTISVTPLTFSTEAATQSADALKAAKEAAGSAQMTEIITTAIKVVGALVLFILVVGLLKRLFKRQEPTLLAAGPLTVVPGGPGDPVLIGTAPPAQLGGYSGAPAAFGLPGGSPTVQLPATAADPAYAQMQADVDALAGADPAQTAEYLRALMGDRARS